MTMKAEQILCDLIAKRDAQFESGAKLADGRREIAFAAHTGDHAARKKLDALNHECATHLSELESLAAAVSEATVRLDAARRDEALKGERAKAHKVRDIVAAASVRGPALAAAAAALRDQLLSFEADLDQLRGLGVAVAQQRLVDLAMTRSISATLREAGLNEFPIVPPHQRHSPAELVAGYLRNPLAWAEKTLGEVSGGSTERKEAAA
jgi:hypothetical protein